MLAREPASLEPRNQDRGYSTQQKRRSPRPIGATSRSANQADCHSRKDKQVIEVIARSLEPASKIGGLQFQPCDLSVAAVENAGAHRQDRSQQCVPIAAQCVQDTRYKADAQR